MRIVARATASTSSHLSRSGTADDNHEVATATGATTPAPGTHKKVV